MRSHQLFLLTTCQTFKLEVLLFLTIYLGGEVEEDNKLRFYINITQTPLLN